MAKKRGSSVRGGSKPGSKGVGSAEKREPSSAPGGPRLYTLVVFLLSGPLTKQFVKKNRVVSRTIQIRGDQTLEDLHAAIFDAFDREDEHLYEFQFGEGPMDPKGKRYALRAPAGIGIFDENPSAGTVDETTLDSLGLTVGIAFGYWFDFGDDWWHQIDVEAIDEKVPPGTYPRLTARKGESPPQYLPEGEDEEDDEDDE